MRPLKISRNELLERCAEVFKRSGYHGATMDGLASACGVTKATFYYHYTSKEALAVEVMAWAHARVADAVFSLAYDDASPAVERFEAMVKKARTLFEEGAVGCLMVILSIDVTYAMPFIMERVRAFLDAWAEAVAHLFAERLPPEAARVAGRQAVADHEGAILMARIYGDFSCFDRVSQRVARQLGG